MKALSIASLVLAVAISSVPAFAGDRHEHGHKDHGWKAKHHKSHHYDRHRRKHYGHSYHFRGHKQGYKHGYKHGYRHGYRHNYRHKYGHPYRYGRPYGYYGSWRPYYKRPYNYYPSAFGAALIGTVVGHQLFHTHNGAVCYESHSSGAYQSSGADSGYSEVVGCHRIEQMPDGSERRVEVSVDECR